MSPDFTQRGTPAIFPKRLRAQAALQNGADLVLELPVCYALAGAQRFAFGAVQLAAAMGCVDLLAFGAEDADLVQLRQACTALQQEEVNQTIRQLLPSGITFAKARERAVAAVYGEETALLLQKPNNILAIEYLCQLEKLPDAHIQPLALGRIGNTHDGEPVGECWKAGGSRRSNICRRTSGSCTDKRSRMDSLPTCNWESGRCYLL